MKNLMEDIAKLLDVELGEEFNIENCLFNPYKMTEEGLINCIGNAMPNTFYAIFIGKYRIIKPLLTQEEKEYLENVLRPYKEDILNIFLRTGTNGNFLGIIVNYEENTGDVDWFNFPYIKKHHFQYKALETNKNYTLKELGLFEGEIER